MTDPECGIVVPVGDIEALTEALRTLLDRPAPDPARLADAVSAYRISAGRAGPISACLPRQMAGRER